MFKQNFWHNRLFLFPIMVAIIIFFARFFVGCRRLHVRAAGDGGEPFAGRDPKWGVAAKYHGL